MGIRNFYLDTLFEYYNMKITYSLAMVALSMGVVIAQENPPNIVFILADDLSWTGTDVKMLDEREDSKSDYYETPNIARLAAEGMRFSNAHSPAPNCSPTRVSLLTGQSPARTQVHTQLNWKVKHEMFYHAAVSELQDSQLTIAEMIESLPDVDYNTAIFGKWHAGNGVGVDHGFDESDYLVTSEEVEAKYGGDPKKTFSISESSIRFMQKSVNEDKPFFIYASYYAVHKPAE